jgi:hypothetical protein
MTLLVSDSENPECLCILTILAIRIDYQMPVVMWTCTEAGVGIIAACLPNLRPLFKTGSRSFWSQLRSFSHGSSKAHLNSDISGTTNSSGNRSFQKGPVDSCVAEEGIEVHRYSSIIGESEK